MEVEYSSLAAQIRACTSCYFRDPSISPLPPALAKVPVSIMFVGENPSWEEGQREPFDEGTASGQALMNHYLRPLGLGRDQVWITDLFKCRYPKAVYRNKQREEANIQREVVEACRHWLLQEIVLVRPKVIVTLSDRQVYRRLRIAFSLPTPARFARAVGKPHAVELAQIPLLLFPMVHPDVARPIGQGDARKLGTRAKWATIHETQHLPALSALLDKV